MRWAKQQPAPVTLPPQLAVPASAASAAAAAHPGQTAAPKKAAAAASTQQPARFNGDDDSAAMAAVLEFARDAGMALGGIAGTGKNDNSGDNGGGGGDFIGTYEDLVDATASLPGESADGHHGFPSYAPMAAAVVAVPTAGGQRRGSGQQRREAPVV